MRTVYQYTLIYLFLFILSSCSHVETKKLNNYNLKAFEFLLDDLKGVDIRDKFMCQFIRFVNMKLEQREFEQNYPIPSSPPAFPSYVISIDNLDSLEIRVIIDDSVLTAVKEKDLRNGYYIFRINTFLIDEMNKGTITDLLKNWRTHLVKIIINRNKFVYKLGNSYVSTVLCE